MTHILFLTLIWYYIIKKRLHLKNIDKIPHIPVLLNEVVSAFNDISSGQVVDCTLGYSGHSSQILKEHSYIELVGIDRDIEALEFSKKRLYQFKDRVTFIHGKFSDKLNDINLSSTVAILADFGVSSLQLDKENRGFKFDSDILDMRMDQSANLDAKDIVNGYSEDDLIRIFKEYGETKEHKRVAKAICSYRKNHKITSSKELSNIIINNSYKKGKIHPATLYFQAIRIEVNSELIEIIKLLDILEMKRPKGLIVALITFHSLEDRLVKRRFREWSKSCSCPSGIMKCICGNNNNLGKEVNRKPIIATKEEIKINPRSRSAKLRVFKFKN